MVTNCIAVQVNAGDVVINQGEIGDHFFFVASGTYQVMMPNDTVKCHTQTHTRARLHVRATMPSARMHTGDSEAKEK